MIPNFCATFGAKKRRKLYSTPKRNEHFNHERVAFKLPLISGTIYFHIAWNAKEARNL